MAERPRLQVSVAQVPAGEHPDAASLAESFGAPVFEPSWWPADVNPIGYLLDRRPHGDSYRIGVGEGGAGFQAAIQREGQTIQCIGYTSESEVITAIKSLRRVTHRPDRRS